MRRLSSILAAIAILFVYSSPVFATSGCCSGHGGVDCSAGPQANGHVVCNDGWTGSSCSYSSMVMCGGSSTQSTTTYTAPPIATIAPTIVPTKVPTIAPRVTPTPTVISTPTATPEVKGAATTAPSATPAPVTTGGVIGGLIVLGLFLGLPIWVIVKVIKHFRKPKVDL